MRVFSWWWSLALAGIVLAACGGGDSGGRPGATSCDAIREIDSYRYTIRLKLDSPAFSGGGSASPAPLSAFADALAALFADLDVNGAYVAPDRTQAILNFGEEDLELRTIGDRSWVRIGDDWQQEDSSEDVALLTPDVVCEDIVKKIAGSLDDVEAQEETVNGVKTDHYRLDEADIKDLPGLLGSNAPPQLPEKYEVDVWLAQKERWPARLKIGAQSKDDSGGPIGLDLFMEFRDVNDSGIQIEPPLIASPQQS